MKKIIFSITTFLLITFGSIFYSSQIIYASDMIIPIDEIQNYDTSIKQRTIDGSSLTSPSTSTVQTINDAGISILTSIKTIISGLLVIYIVYAGAQMIMSMGTEEDQLSSAKRQLWYTVVAFVFINIPGAVFNMFDTQGGNIANTNYAGWFRTPGNESNVFINTFNLGKTLNTDIIGFVEIMISFIAIIMIIIAGINMLTSRGRDEKLSEAKNKIIWSVVALLLVGFLETWKYVVFEGKVEDGANFFETISNLAIFFAGPIAIIFLTIAAYRFITANGNEESIKSARSIVVNVLLATLILIAPYTFLLDLITL